MKKLFFITIMSVCIVLVSKSSHRDTHMARVATGLISTTLHTQRTPPKLLLYTNASRNNLVSHVEQEDINTSAYKQLHGIKEANQMGKATAHAINKAYERSPLPEDQKKQIARAYFHYICLRFASETEIPTPDLETISEFTCDYLWSTHVQKNSNARPFIALILANL